MKEDAEVLYLAPEVGSDRDVGWIKVLSGKVDHRLPSFASNNEVVDTLKEFDCKKR